MDVELFMDYEIRDFLTVGDLEVLGGQNPLKGGCMEGALQYKRKT